MSFGLTDIKFHVKLSAKVKAATEQRGAALFIKRSDGEWKVTEHAFERWIERSRPNTPYRTASEAYQRFAHTFLCSYEIKLPERVEKHKRRKYLMPPITMRSGAHHFQLVKEDGPRIATYFHYEDMPS